MATYGTFLLFLIVETPKTCQGLVIWDQDNVYCLFPLRALASSLTVGAGVLFSDLLSVCQASMEIKGTQNPKL